MPLILTLHANDTIELLPRRHFFMKGDAISLVLIPPQTLPASELRVELSLQGKPLATEPSLHDGILELGLPATALALGTNTLNCRCYQGERLLLEQAVPVALLARQENAVQIDALSGGLLLNGLLFLPFGFYCAPVGDLPDREVIHGFTVIGPYQENLPEGLPARKAYMDRCAELGLKVQYGVNSLVGSGHNGSPGLPLSKEQKRDLLRQEVLAFKNHPALLSWYLNDEPDGQGRPPAELEEAYQLIHSLDPYHPVSVVFMMPSKAALYEHTMDIAMTDPYPIPGPTDSVISSLKAYKAAFGHRKALWLVPQAFGGQEMWGREPTAAEIRLMTYEGFLSGATGIQYYVHGRGNLNPQGVAAWATCSTLAAECTQMTPFLLSTEACEQVESHDPQLLTRVFRYHGYRLLLVANTAPQPRRFTLTWPGAQEAKSSTVELWFENRTLTLYHDGLLQDSIEALGTRVYLLRPASAPLVSDSPVNRLRNGSFEQVTSPGLPDGSNRSEADEARFDEGSTVIADSRVSHTGLFSLRLTTPKEGAGNLLRFLPLVLEKGNSFLIHFWARSARPGAELRVGFLKESKAHGFSLNPSWTEYSYLWTPDVADSQAVLGLQLFSAGTAWVDDLEVRQVPQLQVELRSSTEACLLAESGTTSGELRYSLDGPVTSQSPRYTGPVLIHQATTARVGLFEQDQLLAQAQVLIPLNLAWHRPVELASPPDAQYPAQGASSLTDGVLGSEAFRDGRWLGFSGKALDANITLPQTTAVSQVEARFLYDTNSGIYPPSKFEVWGADEAGTERLLGSLTPDSADLPAQPEIRTLRILFSTTSITRLRIVAQPYGLIPAGRLFSGTVAWLFVDECLVH